MASLAPPLEAAAFEALMAPLGPWGSARRVAVAVSGGADSTCLAWLASRWGRPLGLIVDHGLRAESADEAARAADCLAGFGVPCRILTLRLSPGPGLAARARGARYEALTEAAREAGLTDLLLGHHAGDQAETVLIRQEAGSAPAGLAGMAAIVERPGVRLIRPLLAMPPQRLRATLREAGIVWAEDPSNADPRATRSRMRIALAGEDGRARARAAAACVRQSGAARAARDRRVAEILAARLSIYPQGYGLLSSGPIDPDCLAAIIRSLAGAVYAPRGPGLARLAACPRPATLGGMRLMPAGRLGPDILIVREPACMAPPIQACSGALWDGRFRLHARSALPDGTTLGALGEDASLLRDRSDLPYAVLRTLPALRAGSPPTNRLAVPHIGVFIGWTNGDIGLSFSPSTPVAAAPFTPGGVCEAGGAGDVQRA